MKLMFALFGVLSFSVSAISSPKEVCDQVEDLADEIDQLSMEVKATKDKDLNHKKLEAKFIPMAKAAGVLSSLLDAEDDPKAKNLSKSLDKAFNSEVSNKSEFAKSLDKIVSVLDRAVIYCDEQAADFEDDDEE